MAITINAVRTYKNRAVLNVIKELWDIGKSLPFDSTYLTADSYGNKFLWPGMVVAYKDSSVDEYVPYNSGASYGTSSNAPVGLIYTMYDCTFEKQVVAPASRAAVVEANCYVFGGTLGTIASGIKTADGMKLIQWD